MRLTFLGTGEAYSADRGNVALLLTGPSNVLLECGFTAPAALWRTNPDKDFIDAVWISHFHGDHAAGLPNLCMRMRQENRTKPLTVIGPPGIADYIKQLYGLLYRGFFSKSTFPINFLEADSGRVIEIGGYRLSFAAGKHLTGDTEVAVLAIRIDCDGRSVCYSGDTVYRKEIAGLARGCDLLVHEAYLPADSAYRAMAAHCSPAEAAKIAREAGAKALALVHLHRDYAGKETMCVEAATEFGGKITLPSDGDVFEL